MFEWSPLGALYALWIVWLVSWEIAAVWSSRAQATLGLGRQSLYRVITTASFIALLGTPPFAWRLRGRGARLFSLPPLKFLTTPLWSTPVTIGWILVASAAAGFLFAWWARIHLGQLWSSSITRKANHVIVDTGPYGVVRHPIYTGILASGFALALQKATPAALVGAVVLCAGYWLKGRMEEGFLQSELGAEAYDAYQTRVPMLTPFFKMRVWRRRRAQRTTGE